MTPIKRPATYAQYRLQRKQNRDALRKLFRAVGADYSLFRKMGFSATEVANIEYNYLTKKELLKLFENENTNKLLDYHLLQKIKGFKIPAKKLLEAGYTPLELLSAKYSYSDLSKAGVDVVSLKRKVDAITAKAKEISEIKNKKN